MWLCFRLSVHVQSGMCVTCVVRLVLRMTEEVKGKKVALAGERSAEKFCRIHSLIFMNPCGVVGI